MKKIIIGILSIVIISVLLYSCEKENDKVEIGSEINYRDYSDGGNTDCTFVENGDLMRADIAYALALSMNDTNFKNAFAEKMNSVAESYGEASILFDQLENAKIGKGISMLQFLDQNRNPDLNSGYSSFEDMVSAQPYLRIIYVPTDSTKYEKWEHYDSEIPKVVIVPQEFDEKTNNFVSGFDNTGTPFVLSSNKNPKFPTIVLGFEENWVAINKNTGQSFCGNNYNFTSTDIVFENDNYTYILPPNQDPLDGDPPNPPSSSCERDLKDGRENFLYLQANSNEDIDFVRSYWDRVLEFNITEVAVYNLSKENKVFGKLTKLWNGVYYRLFYKQCWIWQSCDFNKVYYADLKSKELLFKKWRKEKMVDVMKYIAYERDRSDASATFGVSLAGVSGKVKYNPKDDFLGEEEVYYCDGIYPESEAYNFGTFRFGLTVD